MFAAKDRPPYAAAVSSRPDTHSIFPLTTSPEFSPADSAPEPRETPACPSPARSDKRRTLCFDILTNSFCRKPLALIFIQTARGYTPLFCTCSSNLSKMNTYAKCAVNPCRMRTYKIIGLKTPCNEHLQENGGGEVLLLPNGAALRLRRCSPRRNHQRWRLAIPAVTTEN